MQAAERRVLGVAASLEKVAASNVPRRARRLRHGCRRVRVALPSTRRRPRPQTGRSAGSCGCVPREISHWLSPGDLRRRGRARRCRPPAHLRAGGGDSARSTLPYGAHCSWRFRLAASPFAGLSMPPSRRPDRRGLRGGRDPSPAPRRCGSCCRSPGSLCASWASSRRSCRCLRRAAASRCHCSSVIRCSRKAMRRSVFRAGAAAADAQGSSANAPRPICSRMVTTGGFVIERRCQFAPSTTSVWPGDEPRVRRREERGRPTELLALTDAQRGLARVLVGGAVEVAADVVGHVLVREEARHERVHLDAVRTPLDRERLGQVLHAGLGRGRVHEAGPPVHAYDAPTLMIEPGVPSRCDGGRTRDSTRTCRST